MLKNKKKGMVTEPYKVFVTKEEFEAELERILEEQSAEEEPAPKKEAGKDIESKKAEFEAQIAELQKAGVDIFPYLENEEFLTLIDKGHSIISAYFTLTQKETEEKTKKDVYDKLAKKHSRIPENGLGGNKGQMTKLNIAKMSDKEFEELMERVKKGEVIRA